MGGLLTDLLSRKTSVVIDLGNWAAEGLGEQNKVVRRSGMETEEKPKRDQCKSCVTC